MAYEDYRYRVMLEGRYVAAAAKVSGLRHETEGVKHRDGADASTRVSLGRSKFPSITLERGITHDQEFEGWARRSTPMRSDLVLEVADEAGKPAATYALRSCWVSEFAATPDLDAGANAVTIERIVLETDAVVRSGPLR